VLFVQVRDAPRDSMSKREGNERDGGGEEVDRLKRLMGRASFLSLSLRL